MNDHYDDWQRALDELTSEQALTDDLAALLTGPTQVLADREWFITRDRTLARYREARGR